MAFLSANVDISTIEFPSPPPSPSCRYPPTTTMGQSAPAGKNKQSTLSAQLNAEEDENANIDPELLAIDKANQVFNEGLKEQEDENANVDPEILAMLEEANQAFEEGLLEEREAYERELRESQEEKDPFDLEFEQAFATLDEEEPGWDDPYWSDCSDAGSVRSYGFGPLPDDFRNPDDDCQSEGSDGSLFREKIPPVGMRPILKPKSRVKVTPAERAAAAMMPFTVSNPANIPAISFPSNPSWNGDPIPSTGKQTLTFMGVTTSVPVLSDTANVELINNKGVVPDDIGVITSHTFSDSKDKQLVGMAMQELNAMRIDLDASRVRNTALEADFRRMEENKKATDLKVADLETRLCEQIESFNRVLLDSAAGAHMASTNSTKELQICRSALAASQQSCNNLNKENSDLRRQVSELDNATSRLDKESNDIRFQVSELSNHVSFVNGELDVRTRERDFALQKLQEVQFHIDQAVAADNQHRQQVAIMESNAAAKEAEVNNLAAALTKAQAEKQNLEYKSQGIEKQIFDLKATESNVAAKEEELKNLAAALSKAEYEKQDLENKAQEAEKQILELEAREKREKEARAKEEKDRVPPQDDKPERKQDKAMKELQDKLYTATEKMRQVERHAEAYEQDYFETKEQNEVANAKVSQLTNTIAELKAHAHQKETVISQLTQKATKLTLELGELASSADAERTKHTREAEKLKKHIATAEREKEYVGDMLLKTNKENDNLRGINIRIKNKIAELERALRSEHATTSRLQNELKKERESSDDALHVAHIAAAHKAQRTHGLPRPPRENDRLKIPTLSEQLAAWKEDDGISQRFMEDHRRMIRENPLTPVKPVNKIITVEGSEDSSTESGEKTPTAAPKLASIAEAGQVEDTASDFDDSSITAVEPSVSSNDTISELGDVSDADTGPVTYYTSDYNDSHLSPSDARRPKREVKYVEQIVYVDKEVIVDNIIEHTIHQARSPMWAFLFVYVDLWTIFAHNYPKLAAFIGKFNPVIIVIIVVDYILTVATEISDLARIIAKFTKPVAVKLKNNRIAVRLVSGITSKIRSLTRTSIKATKIGIAGRFVSGIPSKISGLIHTKSSSSKPATATLTEIDIESQIEEPTAVDIESQADYLTSVDTVADTHPTVTHKLPQLWPNLITAILQLLTLYLLYQSYLIFDQRHIWLSANEVTRSAVAQFWRRDTGYFGVIGRPSNSYTLERICFWLIQSSGYSYALPG